MAEQYEASIVSGSPSFRSSSPAPRSKKSSLAAKGYTAPSASALTPQGTNGQAASSQRVPVASGSRPGAKPLAQSHGEEFDSRRSGGANRSAGGSDSFLLTAAERKKVETRDSKRESEQCFDFLLDPKDKEGRPRYHPDYDPRTIYIPGSAWDKFTAFERQFWEIKQNHYDTVLFFQKGKFYELYEDDAILGHREFNLKLTDRVKMKMVSDSKEHVMGIGFADSLLSRSEYPNRVSSFGRRSFLELDTRSGKLSRPRPCWGK